MRTEAEFRYVGFVVFFLLAVAALAQFRPAVVITPEDAMRARVRAFSRSDYRIAMLIQAHIEQGRMKWGAALDAIASNDETLRTLVAAQAADPQGK